MLDNGDAKLAIVVCDSCMLPRAVLDAAKHLAHGHTGIPLDQMLISATHAHTCADRRADVFRASPIRRISSSSRRGLPTASAAPRSNLAPAKIGWGIGREATQVFNRRWKMKDGVEARRSVRPAPTA